MNNSVVSQSKNCHFFALFHKYSRELGSGPHGSDPQKRLPLSCVFGNKVNIEHLSHKGLKFRHLFVTILQVEDSSRMVTRALMMTSRSLLR